MEQDEKDNICNIEKYYDAQDEIKAVTKKKGDTGLSKEENYCNLQPDFKEVIERERRIKRQIPNVEFKFCEAAKQYKNACLNKVIGESVEQNRGDSFSEVEIYYDATDKPHGDSEKEISTSIEDKEESVESVELLNEGCVRKVRMRKERSSKARYKEMMNDFCRDHNTELKFLGTFETNERKDFECFQGRIET